MFTSLNIALISCFLSSLYLFPSSLVAGPLPLFYCLIVSGLEGVEGVITIHLYFYSSEVCWIRVFFYCLMFFVNSFTFLPVFFFKNYFCFFFFFFWLVQ